MSGATRRVEVSCERLFDGRRVVDGAVVTVDGGVIAEVRSPGERPLATDALHARFVMPGLVDAHVHVTGYVERMPAGAPFEPVKNFLRMCVVNGVTTLRDTGNHLETIAYAREWGDRFDGPRLVACGPLLDSPPLTWAASRIVRTADDVAREIARLHYEGTDWIKAYRNIAPALLRAIVHHARQAGLPVAVDCEATPPSEALACGVASFEHIVNLLDSDLVGAAVDSGPTAERVRRWAHAEVGDAAAERLAGLFHRHGATLVPTFGVCRRWTYFDELVGDPHLDHMALVMPYHRYLRNLRGPFGHLLGRRFLARYMPVETLTRAERSEADEGFRRMGELLCRLRANGVRVAAGTDSPNPSLAPGFSLHQELGYLVAAGLSPVDALRSATADAAEAIRAEGLGVVAPGAVADLVVVDGDPSRRIEDIVRVDAVMKAGRWVDLETMRQKLKTAMTEGEGAP